MLGPYQLPTSQQSQNTFEASKHTYLRPCSSKRDSWHSHWTNHRLDILIHLCTLELGMNGRRSPECQAQPSIEHRSIRHRPHHGVKYSNPSSKLVRQVKYRSHNRGWRGRCLQRPLCLQNRRPQSSSCLGCTFAFVSSVAAPKRLFLLALKSVVFSSSSARLKTAVPEPDSVVSSLLMARTVSGCRR
jgi:hypothetical protein